MKIAPVSADLLIKLALAGAAGFALWYAYQKITGAAGQAVEKAVTAAGEVADAVITGINPVNHDNIVNRAVSATGAAISGNDSWSLGTWVYDLTHSDPEPPPTTPTRNAYWKS